MNNVKTIKMLGGDEIITRITEHSNGKITTTSPMSIMEGQQGFGLAPYILTSGQKTVDISDQYVITIVDTEQHIATQYLEQVTGLKV